MFLAILTFAYTGCDTEGEELSVYTVTFDANGGEPVPPPQRVRAKRLATAPDTIPEKEGYVFLFWSLNDTTAYDFQTPVINNSVLRAQWQDGLTVVGPALSVDPSELSFTAAAAESFHVDVTTNQQSWNVTSNQKWCSASATKTNRFTVTAEANTGTSNRTATITVTAGNAPNAILSVTQESGGAPNIAISGRTPIIEYLYSKGFFCGSRVNYNLIVYEPAGKTSIKIEEEAKGISGVISKQITQTREIPISGPGTYPLSQEIVNSNEGYANIFSQFTYTVSAFGKSYTTTYSGNYNTLDGAWSHYFGIK